MSDGPDNPAIRLLRQIEGKLDRALSIDMNPAGPAPDLDARVNSVERRLDRLERRLDLLERTVGAST